MNDLQKELQYFFGTNNIFLKFFQQNYTEGFWFWEVNRVETLLIDSKYAAKFKLNAGDLDLNSLDDQPLKNSILKNLLEIEKTLDLTEEGKADSLSIKDAKHYLEVKYLRLKNDKTGRLFVFAALEFVKETDIISEAFIDMLEIGTWKWNIQTNELVVNKKYAELLGCTLQELTPMTFEMYENLAHPEDHKEIEKRIDDYLSGRTEVYSGESRLKHKNGNWVWVSGNGKLVSRTEDGKPEWMIGSHVDITDKKLFELEMGSLPLVALKSNISVVIGDKDGKITFTNKAFENLTGYTSQEVFGKKPGDFLQGEETRPENKEELSRKIRSGKPFTQEIINYKKNGEKYWISLHINPIYSEKGVLEKFLSVQIDISEQKKYEAYLNTFKSTLDQTEDCVFLFDKDNFQFFYVNKGAELMMEYTSEELLQLHAYDIKPGFTHKEFKEIVNPLLTGEQKSIRFETIHRSKSGKNIPVEAYIQFIKKDVNEPYFVGIVHDITSKRQLEKEMERLSLVAEKTNNLVVIADKSGLIEYVNPAFEQKTGYSLEEVIGKKPGYFLHGAETDPAHIQSNRENLKKLQPFTQEILNYTRSGEKYWVSITFNPVFNTAGELEKFIAIETDITDRKNREEKLKESEERLNLVLKGSELGYWDWQFETDELNVNDRWLEMLGYNREDITPSIQAWHELVHPEDRVKLDNIMEDIFPNPAKNDFSVVVRAKHKKGHYIWIQDKGAVVIRDKEGKPSRISGIHSDISKEKALEQSLQQEREFLSNIMQNNAAAILVLDNNGLIKYANPSAHIVIGFSKTELEGKAFFDPKFKMYKVDGSELSVEEHPFSILKGKNQPIYDQRIAFEGPDEKKRFISMSGAPMSGEDKYFKDFVFSILDITERVQTQFQLENTKKQLESILSEMSDVIYSYSVPDYELIYITPSVKKVFGLAESNFLGNSLENIWPEIIYKKDKDVLKDIFQMLEKSGEYETTYRILTPDNKIKYIYNKGKYVYKNNIPIRMDGYIADVTEDVKKENNLKKYLEVVEGQNERLKNFTYIVSHNLRSHSANMQGLMYLIKDTHPKIFENEYIQKLEQTSSKLDETLHQLNEVVSVVSSVEELKKVNVQEKVQSLHNAFSNLLSSSEVKLLNQIEEDVHVEAVPAYLESILTNLITNAIKYRDPEKESYVKLWNESPDGVVNIIVEDNGLGIDLDKYGNKIFGMYKTFHSHKDARGIGLFLAKNQAESMGGKIQVESKAGVGTTFKLILKNDHV